jgi:hypothetical protein
MKNTYKIGVSVKNTYLSGKMDGSPERPNARASFLMEPPPSHQPPMFYKAAPFYATFSFNSIYCGIILPHASSNHSHRATCR